MSHFEKRIQQIQIGVGICLMASPWILGFSSIRSALWANVVLGGATFLLGLWGMFGKEE